MTIQDMLDIWAMMSKTESYADKIWFPSGVNYFKSRTATDFGKGFEQWEHELNNKIQESVDIIYTEELTLLQQKAVFNRHVTSTFQSARNGADEEKDYAGALIILKRGMIRRHFLVD